ncbi:hypothetical protein Bca52824_011297 [Brassica carinata]|uniref:Uncharacterized protein n=1 Tax=Brassica carinata TaxID=52824 RepID=A0A8X8B8D2_BRACI|nr:hypothetical protein Bca52824_011297 [Brassica carinata]
MSTGSLNTNYAVMKRAFAEGMEATAGPDCALLEELCLWMDAKAMVPRRDIILAGGSKHGADQSSKHKEPLRCLLTRETVLKQEEHQNARD